MWNVHNDLAGCAETNRSRAREQAIFSDFRHNLQGLDYNANNNDGTP